MDESKREELSRLFRELESLGRPLTEDELVRLFRAFGPELSRRAILKAFPDAFQDVGGHGLGAALDKWVAFTPICNGTING